MWKQVERRHGWSRIVGLERRGAILSSLMGRAFPDPTRLLDEDFLNATPSDRKVRSKEVANQGTRKTMLR
jgi:hypothetical protein